MVERMSDELRLANEREFVLSVVHGFLNEKNDELAHLASWFNPEWIFEPAYQDLVRSLLVRVHNGEPVSPGLVVKDSRTVREKHNLTLEATLSIYAEARGWWQMRVLGKTIHDQWRAVSVVSEASEAASQLTTGHKDVEETIDHLTTIGERYRQLEFNSGIEADAALAEVIAELEGIRTPKFRCGIDAIDDLIGGFRNGALTTVAAQTGRGKSVFLGQLAHRRAFHDKKLVMFFSAEMTLREMMSRWAALHCGERSANTPTFKAALAAIHEATKTEGLLQFFSGPRHVDRIVSQVYARRNGGNLGLVCVDYIQLFGGGGNKDNRERQVADVSSKLKGLAIECGVPVVAASQLNRQTDGNGGFTTDSMRESGAIANDSDCVVTIMPDSNEKDGECDAEFRALKNRHGRIGSAQVRWVKPLFEFRPHAIDDPAPFSEFSDYGTQGDNF